MNMYWFLVGCDVLRLLIMLLCSFWNGVLCFINFSDLCAFTCQGFWLSRAFNFSFLFPWKLALGSNKCLMIFMVVIVSGGFGASGLKIKNLDFGCVRPKLRTLQPLHGLRTQKIVRFDGLVLLHRPKMPINVCRSSASEDDCELLALILFVLLLKLLCSVYL